MLNFAMEGNPADFQSLRGFGDVPPIKIENPFYMLFLVLSQRLRGILGRRSKEKGKIIFRQIVASGQHHGAFDCIFQLTDISGPGIILQGIEGLLINSRHRFIGFLSDAFQKVLRQLGNIINASLKRRYFQLDDVQPVIKILPEGASIDYAGESRQLRTEGGAFLGTFLLSALLIYLVLAAQFESFRDPFIVLAGSVPLALSGALLFSFLGLTTLNIYSQVGLITLVGLIAKNGILIVEFANTVQERGVGKAEAVIEAAQTRLRPILMTTAATVMGHMPLVFASGPGAGARNSIGIMLVTGMIIGTAFTLFVVPAIYVLVAKTHRAEAAVEEPEGPHKVGELEEAAV